MSVFVVRAFVKLRDVLNTNQALARRFDKLESRLNGKLTEHAEAIAAILLAVCELMKPPETPHRGIGFTADLGDDSSWLNPECGRRAFTWATRGNARLGETRNHHWQIPKARKQSV